jgi:hypothetical protein
MKRLGLLTFAASLGAITLPTHFALAFDGEAYPPGLFVHRSLPLSLCLENEKQGYPNPGPDGCAYLDAGRAGYVTVWVPEALPMGRSVAPRTW